MNVRLFDDGHDMCRTSRVTRECFTSCIHTVVITVGSISAEVKHGDVVGNHSVQTSHNVRVKLQINLLIALTL